MARTCFGRHRTTRRTPRTCFGRHRESDPASHGLLRQSTAVASAIDELAGHPAPRYLLRQALHEGGRARSARKPDRDDAHFGGRRFERWEAPPRASADGGFNPASAGAKGTLEDSDGFGRRPEWLRPSCDLGEARRLRSSGVHSRSSSSEEGRSTRDGASRSVRRRTPTNLFATLFENPGNRVGETGRMDGNDREAMTAAMRHGC